MRRRIGIATTTASGGWPTRGVVLVLSMALPLWISCGDSSPPRQDPPLVRGTTPPSSAGVEGAKETDAEPDPQQEEADAISAYRHNWSVLNQAYSDSSVVGLHRVASGPFLYAISDDILYGVHYGLIIDGGMTHHPTLESISEDRAVVIDCALTTNEYRDALSGETLSEDSYWRELRIEMLRDDGGVWKLHDGELVSEDCEPPAPQI